MLNAEGATPVYVEGEGSSLPGADVIAFYLDETLGPQLGDRRLMPEGARARAEARRLTNWFNVKFFHEVSHWLVQEKIYKRYKSPAHGGGAPDMDAVRAARVNMRYHLRYIGHLIGARTWLAGGRMSYADLAAAAHLSCVDYLGDAQWHENEIARDWYARMKSRPTFRPLLAERLPGMPASPTYADLDF
jgi:glutathione S-transferase